MAGVLWRTVLIHRQFKNALLDSPKFAVEIVPGVLSQMRLETDRGEPFCQITDFRHELVDGEGTRNLFQGKLTGRQLLHVTFGSVLTAGADSARHPFKESILECLGRNNDLHQELLESHFSHHLSLLNAG